MSELRAALEEAIDEDLEQQGLDPSSRDDDPPAPVGGSHDEPPGQTAEGDTSEGSSLSQDLTKAAEEDAKNRGEDGKFTKNPQKEVKSGIVPAFKGEPKQPPADPNAQPADGQSSALKAPQSWKPDEREGWEKVPAKMQEAVIRREREMVEYMRSTADDRRFAQGISKTMQPFQGLLQTLYPSPEAAVDDLCKTLNILHTAPIPVKTQALAQLITQTVGKDTNALMMLDQALAGQAPQIDPIQQRIEQEIQQRMAPIQQQYQEINQYKQQQAEASRQQAFSAVDQFLAQKPYGNDVSAQMANIMQVGLMNGQEITLDEAYRQACMLNPTISQLIMQQQQAQAAQQKSQAAQRARGAAVSVSGSPAGTELGTDNSSDSIRSAVEAAFNASIR